MFHRSIVASLLAAMTILVPAFAQAGGAATMPPVMQRRTLPLLKIAKPRPFRVRTSTAAGGTAAYTLVDDGAPAAPYALSNPVAFNDTGQIAGYGFDTNGAAHCMLFDGKHYRDLSSAKSFIDCNVSGMNDEALSGEVDVVGYGRTIFSAFEKAVFASVNVKSGAVRNLPYANDESLLTGVNDSGKAIGYGVYSPAAGFAVSKAPFIVTQGASTLNVLQPSCSTIHLGCGAYNDQFFDEEATCGFGGCQIVNDGTILLTDLFTGSYETIAADGTTRDLPLDANMESVPLINNSGQLVYSVETVVRGGTTVQTQLFAIATGSIVKAPPIAGNSCTQYQPISFNDSGDVLGYTANCPKGDYAYFVFRPGIGTQNLTSAFPSGDYYIQPYGVNNEGQILVTVESTVGSATHWGFLAPSNPAGARRRSSAGYTFADAGQTSAGLRASTEATAALPRRRALPAAARAIHLRARSMLAPGQMYTIVDYGAPATQAYTLQNPVAFNNTGQIVGTARNIPFSTSTTCVLFDGARFRNISASPTVVNCSPMSINDENPASGSLNVVGSVISAFSAPDDTKAFESRITPKTSFVGTTIFAANDMSDLTGINASGLAVGVGFYLPQGANAGDAYTIFAAAPGKQSIAPLAAACNSAGFCGNLYPQACAFGGCEVTADGTIYLRSELVNPDGTVTPLNIDRNAVYPIINNAKQLLYYVSPASVASDTVYYKSQLRIYQIGSGLVTTIYKLPNSTCYFYHPLSFNNNGHVLGVTDGCSKPADETYFTFDTTNGTQDLLAELPPGNASVKPVGINDLGQILTALTLPSGAIHWGILAPPAAQNVHARQREVRVRTH